MHPNRIRRQFSGWLQGQTNRLRDSVRSYILQEHPSILEIGPALNPFLIDPDRVKYFDVLPTDELARFPKRYNRSLEGLTSVPIHYCSPTGDLEIIEDRFEAVFSSHCIEHCPDLVRHLQTVSSLLTERGRYFLFIPDKRYCFDHFFPESGLVDVLEAWHEARSVHTLASKLRSQACRAHNDSVRHWMGLHGRPKAAPERILELMAEYGTQDKTSINAHAWFFTPAGFREILDGLHALGLVDLRLVYLTRTRPGRFEFCAILAKKDSPPIRPGALQQDSWLACLLQTPKRLLFNREEES